MSTIQCPSSFLIFFLIVATARIHVAFSAIAMECLEMTDPTAVVDEATHGEILRCNFCNTPRFYFLERLRNPGTNSLCYSKYLVKFGDDSVSDRISRTFLDYQQVQGHFWDSDEDALMCFKHLLMYMPFRDQMLLFQESDTFLNYLTEHVRLALHVRYSGPKWATNKTLLSDSMFLENVLPYNFLNEKRDVEFNWRSRFHQLLSEAVAETKTATEAMRVVAAAMPVAAPAGVLVLNSTAVPGSVVRWQSETSPMRLSPEQVVLLGGASCTGTAITMAAAARSVGIPARVAGCSQSIPNDDHHWLEFYDVTASGPFADNWHTKEGTSLGNANGPWDEPSIPMSNCLAYLVPRDPKGLNTIWASSYSSSQTMPLQWHPSVSGGAPPPAWASGSSVTGVCRCGVYCEAWGCGRNHTEKYTQAQCEV